MARTDEAFPATSRWPVLDQWWALVVRGLLAIAFGVLALIWPGLTLIALIALFAGLALADGIISVVAAIRTKSWGWLFWGGLLSIALGVLVIFSPAAAGLALLLFIGAWLIVRGIFDIGMAISLRREIRYEWLLGVAGLLSILFGVFVIVYPSAGALAVVAFIAAFAIFIGLTLIAAGFHERKLRSELAHRAQPAL